MATEGDDSAPYRPVDRGIARKQAFLDAARQVFLQHGYQAASVNDVVRIAGGSLATLYSQFGNKDGLFAAVVMDQHARFTTSLTPESVGDLPLYEALCAVGERFVTALLEPDNLAFFRLVVSESRHFPLPLRRNITVGAEHVRDILSEIMRKHGVPLLEDDSAPSMLIELWRSRYHYRALANETFKLPPEDVTRHVRRSVDIFLHGVLRATS